MAAVPGRRGALRFEPGVRYECSNTGYVLLAEVIARASGRGFAAFLASNILAPLGMTETSVVQKGGPAIEHRATGHRKEGARFVVDDVRDHWTLGSGGLYSSLRDDVTWYRGVVTGRLLRPSPARRRWRACASSARSANWPASGRR